MAKTAVDLTAEEARTYQPGKGKAWDEARLGERWEQAWTVARVAARLLREKFGASRVVVFGSLAKKPWFGPWSDIDLAAWGIPADQFYRAVAAVTGGTPDFEVDLVDPAECQRRLRERVEREGIDL